jgi:hypothetical protein
MQDENVQAGFILEGKKKSFLAFSIVMEGQSQISKIK